MLGVRVAIEKRSAGWYIIRDDRRSCSSKRVERRDFCAKRRDAGRPGRIEDRRRGRKERTGERKIENEREKERASERKGKKRSTRDAERASGGRTSVAFDMDRR